jgi:hypothetical protein
MEKRTKEEYKEEGLRRMKLRKAVRLQNYIDKCYDKINAVGCQVCGEHPYCYCGDGTPYSY